MDESLYQRVELEYELYSNKHSGERTFRAHVYYQGDTKPADRYLTDRINTELPHNKSIYIARFQDDGATKNKGDLRGYTDIDRYPFFS